MKKELQNEPDIVALLTRLQGQVAALDRKMDSLINKSFSRTTGADHSPKPSFDGPVYAHTPVRPVEAVQPVQASARPQTDQHKGRQMHQAVCADCKKECEIPFKPSGDRPVYCKECFMQRKTANRSKSVTPPEQAPVSAPVSIQEPPVKEKKKPAAVKKPVAKKKPAPKKKK